MSTRSGTKVVRRALLLVVPLVMAVAASGFAQTTWSKLEGNPVLTPGAAGEWDATAVKAGDVFFDGSTYHMWYTGEQLHLASDIGYATSPDGIEWTKHPANPVLTRGQAGDWDEAMVYLPAVVWDGSSFHMWYTGGREAAWGGNGIGYATSPDGVAWTKHAGNPVLEGGAPGAWDETSVVAGAVVADETGFTMWYSGWGEQEVGSWIGRATSLDGIAWARSSAPVNTSLRNTTDLWSPEVIEVDNGYRMWVSAEIAGEWAIYHAVSGDGQDWVFDEGGPILETGPAGTWDGFRLVAPRVLIGQTTAQMWYGGLAELTSSAVGYASAATGEFEPAFVHGSWVEIAAHQDGDAGSQWRTDLVIQNTSDLATVVELTLHTEDGDISQRTTVEGLGQAIFEDVVALLDYAGRGSIEVLSEQRVRVVARIYNQADTGTFGQVVEMSLQDRALQPGESAWLVGLRQAEGLFRSNISVTNIDSVPAVVGVTLYDTNGHELTSYTLMVQPGMVEQDLQPFRARADRPNLGWGYAEVSLTAGGRILASASVVDSMTNDATTIPMQR